MNNARIMQFDRISVELKKCTLNYSKCTLNNGLFKLCPMGLQEKASLKQDG